MQLSAFQNSPCGSLVAISGHHPTYGAWEHAAFRPHPLAEQTPPLQATTFNAVARARAALAALDAAARQLPNAALLRRPTLRREAQSTSALEGTYAPLDAVLAVDDDEREDSGELHEVLNYVRAAEHAFASHADGRGLSLGLLLELHGILVQGTAADGPQAGRIRDIQVVIGAQRLARVQDARFIPPPPGLALDGQVRDWVDWVVQDHAQQLDPVVAAAMAHYQFETLHPFNDGNGRLGRLLVVMQLLATGVLTEPTLTVSPWFEARRADYYDTLLGVSTTGAWDPWVRFFADGLASSADDTGRQLSDLLRVQTQLKTRIRASHLRAETAVLLVDFALSRPIFSVKQVQRHVGVTYARANKLVGQLVELGILRQYDDRDYDRRFAAPDVLAVLLRPAR